VQQEVFVTPSQLYIWLYFFFFNHESSLKGCF